MTPPGNPLRVRALLLVLVAALALWVWVERQAAAERSAGEARAGAAAARAQAESRRQSEREERLARLGALLERRRPAPGSVAAVRERLLAIAAPLEVSLPLVRLSPLARPPRGVAGAEAQLTAEGETDALVAFVAAVEGRGWPLRFERTQLTEPAGAAAGRPSVLTATVSVLWPAPAPPSSPAATARRPDESATELADDPRLPGLLEGLEALLAGPDADEGPPPPAPASRVAAADPGDSGEPEEDLPAAEAPPPPRIPRAPELHGFVDLGGGQPVQAALFFEGETVLVSAGDRLGAYRVVAVEPADSVLLSRPDGPPLLLTLR